MPGSFFFVSVAHADLPRITGNTVAIMLPRRSSVYLSELQKVSVMYLDLLVRVIQFLSQSLCNEY